MRQFIAIFMVLVLLPSCVTTTDIPNKSPQIDNVIIDNESSTLNAWWTFLNDSVLDSFVSSALNLNYKNNSSKNDLAFDIVNKYIQYRYIQNQKSLLSKYIIDRSSIIADSKLNPHQKSLLKKEKSFEDQMVVISSDITNLTKLMPEYVEQLLREKRRIPKSDITPILASEAKILSNAHKIYSTRSKLVENSRGSISWKDTATIFPNITIGRFFGISDDVYSGDNQKWSISVGEAIRNIDLQRLNKLYKGKATYKEFVENIYSSILDIEHKIVSFANMQEQYIVLSNAFDKYMKECSTLKDYKSRNSPSSSISKVCEDAYNTNVATLSAEYNKSEILIDIYKAIAIDLDPRVRTH